MADYTTTWHRQRRGGRQPAGCDESKLDGLRGRTVRRVRRPANTPVPIMPIQVEKPRPDGLTLGEICWNIKQILPPVLLPVGLQPRGKA